MYYRCAGCIYVLVCGRCSRKSIISSCMKICFTNAICVPCVKLDILAVVQENVYMNNISRFLSGTVVVHTVCRLHPGSFGINCANAPEERTSVVQIRYQTFHMQLPATLNPPHVVTFKKKRIL